MKFEIIKHPDPVLRQIAKPVELFDEELKKIAESMTLTMIENKGIGLAAPQVGLSIQMIIVLGKAMINPKIVNKGERTRKEIEGCLSLPGIRVEVERPHQIRINYQDLDGKSHEETYNGYFARVIQHETDHLQGVLITDHGN